MTLAMPTPPEARDRASSTYNAAADTYDAGPLSFWEYFGNRTVNRLQLRDGDHVLDVACGSGGSALPAAQAVAPSGTVMAVDLAERLLALAQTKAIHRNLRNIHFQLGDMLALDQPNGKFDVVICVFGIFFVPDMVAAARELWRMVRPGGKLAITTWGKALFEPGNSAFWDSIKRVRPELERAFNPWDRISEPTPLQEMLKQAGIEFANVAIEGHLHPIGSPEDWWTIVCGSGYRGTLEQLSEKEYQVVRQANLDYVREYKIDAVQTNALYAIAQKSPLMRERPLPP